MATLDNAENFISLRDFYLSHLDELFGSPNFRKKILNYSKFSKEIPGSTNERDLFEKIFTVYIEEAELTLSLLERRRLTSGDALLEVGGGVGLAYGFLKSRGFDIYAIEPSKSGHGGYYETALEMFTILNIDASHWYPLSVTECVKLNKKFDIIFSNYVLEHIQDLRSAFVSMKGVLSQGGIMIHHTVNYTVPYEPHFRIILFPFFPRLTSFLKPALKKSPRWHGLNFITARTVKSICRSCDLDIEFERGILIKTLERLDDNPEFSMRQGHFLALYHLLRRVRFLKLLNLIRRNILIANKIINKIS